MANLLFLQPQTPDIFGIIQPFMITFFGILLLLSLDKPFSGLNLLDYQLVNPGPPGLPVIQPVGMEAVFYVSTDPYGWSNNPCVPSLELFLQPLSYPGRALFADACMGDVMMNFETVSDTV